MADQPTFEREERYIVIKRSHLSPPREIGIKQWLADNEIPTVECVVVESDWPEYDLVWQLIEQRCLANQRAQQVPADTHAPPEGYEQLEVPTHGDPPINGPTYRLTPGQYPATIFAMNLVRMDSGGPSWPAVAAPLVPGAWFPALAMIERALDALDGGDRSSAGLGTEMGRFTMGSEDEIAELIAKGPPQLALAHVFLNDFFDGWSDSDLPNPTP